MEREKLSSRLGFILVSAGCAIGLGNVWRFPYIVGQYGGAAFILMYLAFLVIFGVPIMSMEFAIGRASKQSIADSFRKLEPTGTKWHIISKIPELSNYVLMMFYTTVSGWMFIYFIKMLKGDFAGLGSVEVSAAFDNVCLDPWLCVGFMLLVVAIGFFVCSMGLKKGVEKITKIMMIMLLVIIVVIAIKAITLPGAGEGLKYYLIPDFNRMVENGLTEAIFAALGQAFFTLSIGSGAMMIFGSYIDKDRSLFGESITVAALDTFVAFVAGLIIIPSCSAYNIAYTQGPGLIFEALPNVFNSMPGGRVWGSLFFVFMIFAAMSTVIAVFENLISCSMEKHGWSRRKACLINFIIVSVLALPCALGFNVLSAVQPFGAGSTILDLEDFFVSNTALPLGSLLFVLFCVWDKKGWGWNNFIEEVNMGNGIKFPVKLKIYFKYILPILLVIILAQGYIEKFFL